jgi:hypothetical protein
MLGGLVDWGLTKELTLTPGRRKDSPKPFSVNINATHGPAGNGLCAMLQLAEAPSQGYCMLFLRGVVRPITLVAVVSASQIVSFEIASFLIPGQCAFPCFSLFFPPPDETDRFVLLFIAPTHHRPSAVGANWGQDHSNWHPWLCNLKNLDWGP